MPPSQWVIVIVCVMPPKCSTPSIAVVDGCSGLAPHEPSAILTRARRGDAISTVDIHTHILPRHIPDFRAAFGYGGFVTLDHQSNGTARMMRDGVFFREIDANCWDPEVRLAECDVSGIAIQVLSTVPVMFSYWAKPEDGATVARALNDDLAVTVAAHPSRFVGLGTLPMQDPDLAIAELERCLQLGLTGVQIGTHINDWNLNDPEVFAVLEAASSLGAPVFVHPWDMMGTDRMPKYWLPWLVGMPAETSLAISSAIFGGVFDRLPNLRMAFAHGGGSFPGTIGRIQHGYDVRPDLCAIDNEHGPRHYLGRFWTDSLTHDEDALRSLVSLIGADRVALGTDYPFPLGESVPGSLIETTYPPDARERGVLLRTAALEWLGTLTPERQG